VFLFIFNYFNMA